MFTLFPLFDISCSLHNWNVTLIAEDDDHWDRKKPQTVRTALQAPLPPGSSSVWLLLYMQCHPTV